MYNPVDIDLKETLIEPNIYIYLHTNPIYIYANINIYTYIYRNSSTSWLIKEKGITKP